MTDGPNMPKRKEVVSGKNTYEVKKKPLKLAGAGTELRRPKTKLVRFTGAPAGERWSAITA
jgi:hypothetical protein